MASLIARTVPVALVFAVMSSASFAQDRPNTTLVQKSKSSAVTPAAASRSKSQAATVNSSATVKSGSKQSVPAAESSSPVSERSYEGCDHAKGAEA